MEPRVGALLALLFFLGWPCQALANAGTPLMWAGILHLMFGNALIGVGEGLLIAWLFSLQRGKTIGIMIAANYFSAWVGGLFVVDAIVERLALDLNNGWQWFWIMTGLTYLITLILELPFVAWCLRRTEKRLSKNIRANFLAQTASYTLLFGWYWMASGTSLYRSLHVVTSAEMGLPDHVSVYFISDQDGAVYKRGLMSGSPEKIFDLKSTNTDDRLFARPNSHCDERWDVVARLEEGRAFRLVEIATNMAVHAAPDWRTSTTIALEPPETWFNFGEAMPLGSATNSPWEFWTGFWPMEGLSAKNEAAGVRVRFAYETPFGAWTARNAVHLPTDKVLFQLGENQICAFDPQARRIALLWHGRGPVPVIESAEAVTTTNSVAMP